MAKGAAKAAAKAAVKGAAEAAEGAYQSARRTKAGAKKWTGNWRALAEAKPHSVINIVTKQLIEEYRRKIVKNRWDDIVKSETPEHQLLMLGTDINLYASVTLTKKDVLVVVKSSDESMEGQSVVAKLGSLDELNTFENMVKTVDVAIKKAVTCFFKPDKVCEARNKAASDKMKKKQTKDENEGEDDRESQDEREEQRTTTSRRTSGRKRTPATTTSRRMGGGAEESVCRFCFRCCRGFESRSAFRHALSTPLPPPVRTGPGERGGCHGL